MQNLVILELLVECFYEFTFENPDISVSYKDGISNIYHRFEIDNFQGFSGQTLSILTIKESILLDNFLVNNNINCYDKLLLKLKECLELRSYYNKLLKNKSSIQKVINDFLKDNLPHICDDLKSSIVRLDYIIEETKCKLHFGNELMCIISNYIEID